MTTLYCGMTGTNGPEMFDCMDAALNNGAEGISIFTISSLRSPEVRARFKEYADSARASRKLAKSETETPVTKEVNPDPFQNSAIMNAVNLTMQSQLSLAKAMTLPELKKADQAMVERLVQNAMRGKTAEDYVDLLVNAPRRDESLQPVAKAIADQFMKDNETTPLNLGDYQLADEYGATKCYKVTEQNSNVVFDVTFYFYGGILSGWSVKPEEASYKKYISGLAS